jgi:transposase
MAYVGLDIHKEFCQAAVIDKSGRVLSNERFSSTQEELDEFLDQFKKAKFVLESTGIWEFFYEGIENRGFEAVLAHPLKVRAIAEARVKTDKVDAETLAQLLRTDLIPRSWVPSKDMRDLRQLVRQRAYLTRQSTSLKNRIHAELLRRGVRRPGGMLKPFSKKHVAWMRSLDFPTVDSCLFCLENIQAQIEELNAMLLDEFERRPDAQLIATIPGIGFYGALLTRGDRRCLEVPEPREALRILRARADCEPIRLLRALRRSEQGRFVVSPMDTHRDRPHPCPIQPGFAPLDLPCANLKAERQAEGDLGDGQETRPYHILDARQETTV